MKYLFLIGLVSIFSFITKAQTNQICSFKSSSDKKLGSQYDLYKTSGNFQIDNETNLELQFLASTFLVAPNFYFYNDNDGKNAKASDEITNGYMPDGTIIFGKRLFNNAFLTPNGLTAIPIIIAHEFAHIADFKYGTLQGYSDKKKELFADYLAGMYMSFRIRTKGFVDLNAAETIFKELGDTDFGNVNHHGTPEERVNALMEGYYMAEGYINNGKGYLLTLKKCIEEAKNYLKSVKDAKDPEVIDPE